MKHHASNDRPPIPREISFTRNKRKTHKIKGTKSDSSHRRFSFPTEQSKSDESAEATRRRSTMPQVTQEMKDSLLPLHELAALLMLPSSSTLSAQQSHSVQTMRPSRNNERVHSLPSQPTVDVPCALFSQTIGNSSWLIAWRKDYSWR